jgi:cytochrome c5
MIGRACDLCFTGGLGAGACGAGVKSGWDPTIIKGADWATLGGAAAGRDLV